jgi:hypothetical protein
MSLESEIVVRRSTSISLNMKTSEKKLAKEILLAEVATLLLRDVDLKLEVKARIRKIDQKMIKNLPKEEYQALLACKNTVVTLAEKLISCEDPVEVSKAFAFVRALNTGEIYEAAEGQIIES